MLREFDWKMREEKEKKFPSRKKSEFSNPNLSENFEKKSWIQIFKWQISREQLRARK